MRRILCFALAAVMLCSLAACGEENKPKNTEPTAALTEPQTETETADETEAPVTESATGGSHDVISLDFIKSFDHDPAIDQQTVYEKDGLTITATEIRYDTVKGPQIMLQIINETENDLRIQNDYTVVNGFMMRPEINAGVAASKTVDTPMSLPYLGLAMADIHSLSEVEFSLRILDNKTYSVIDTTPTVQLALTGTQEEQEPYDDEGQTVYDADDVRVVVKGIRKDTLFDCKTVVLVYMENHSDITISVLNTKLSVNGYDITTAMHTVILPGKRAVDKIELFDNELEDYGITTIDSVDVAFDINDYEAWDVIASADTVSLKMEKSVDAEIGSTAEE